MGRQQNGISVQTVKRSYYITVAENVLSDGAIWLHSVLHSAVAVGAALSKRKSDQTNQWWGAGIFSHQVTIVWVLLMFNIWKTLLEMWRLQSLNRKCEF